MIVYSEREARKKEAARKKQSHAAPRRCRCTNRGRSRDYSRRHGRHGVEWDRLPASQSS